MPTKPHRKRILIRSFMSFMDNDLTTAAAAVSYFSMLTLFPMLVLLLAIGNSILGAETVEKYVLNQVLAFLPGAREFVRKNLDSIASLSTGLQISCALVVLWAASWMFTVIEKALNRVWGTYPRAFLRGRAWNIAVMSSIWLLLGTSALLTAFITGVRAAAAKFPLRLGAWFTELSGYAWQSIFLLASLAVTMLPFTLLYHLPPNTHVPFKEALWGAIVAGVLWEGAKIGFALLLPYFHYDLLYGSIGAAVTLLSWVYFSSVIMLYGAQFTALLHREHLYETTDKKPRRWN